MSTEKGTVTDTSVSGSAADWASHRESGWLTTAKQPTSGKRSTTANGTENKKLLFNLACHRLKDHLYRANRKEAWVEACVMQRYSDSIDTKEGQDAVSKMVRDIRSLQEGEKLHYQTMHDINVDLGEIAQISKMESITEDDLAYVLLLGTFRLEQNSGISTLHDEATNRVNLVNHESQSRRRARELLQEYGRTINHALLPSQNYWPAKGKDSWLTGQVDT